MIGKDILDILKYYSWDLAQSPIQSAQIYRDCDKGYV